MSKKYKSFNWIKNSIFVQRAKKKSKPTVSLYVSKDYLRFGSKLTFQHV